MPVDPGFSRKRSRIKKSFPFQTSLGRSTVERPGDVRRPYEPNKQVRDFQPYGVGKPKYGSGRSMPNLGPVTGKEGYRERDLTHQAYKNRAMKLLKARKAK